MRLFINILSFLVISTWLYGSTFKLAVHDSSVQIVNGESVDLKVDIINISSDPIYWQITRLMNDIPDTWTSAMCFGGICYAPFINEIMFDINANNSIQPGDSAEFKITFNTNPDSSLDGQVLIQFMDLFTEDTDSVLLKVSTKPEPVFQVRQKDYTLESKPGLSTDLSGTLVNLTEQPLDLVITRILNDIPADWTSSICIGTSCYAPTLGVINESLPPGDSLDLKVTFNTGAFPGAGKVQLNIENQANEQTEIVEFELLTKTAFLLMLKDTSASGPVNSDIKIGGNIRNFADSVITIEMILLDQVLPESWASSLCLGENCTDPEVSAIADTIAVGDSLSYAIQFSAGSMPASGKALLGFVVRGDQDTTYQWYLANSEATAVEDFASSQPRDFKILSNYPNPFNNSTMISFHLPEMVTGGQLRIFDVTGAEIVTRKLGPMSTGTHQIPYTATGENNRDLSSGMYILHLGFKSMTGKQFSGKQKLMLIK